MRVGIVCEGATDISAITEFLRCSLNALGRNPEFSVLFPAMDRTRPVAGWGNVLHWLRNNPPAVRIQRYFGGGLFSGSLAEIPLDAIVIHLDTDVLNEGSFQEFVRRELGIDLGSRNLISVSDRGAAIKDVLSASAKLADLTAVDVRRHVLAPAVESTETWCIAAFRGSSDDFESLRDEDLTTAFMHALERSEGRVPKSNYAVIDKDVGRRARFCSKHQSGADRIYHSCVHYRDMVDALKVL